MPDPWKHHVFAAAAAAAAATVSHQLCKVPETGSSLFHSESHPTAGGESEHWGQVF